MLLRKKRFSRSDNFIDCTTEELKIPKAKKTEEAPSKAVNKVKGCKSIKSSIEEKENGTFDKFDSEITEYQDLNSTAMVTIDKKHKIAVRVKRSEESAQDLGLLYFDIQHWVDSDVFTGFTKQKIHIPLWKLPELKLVLEDVLQECYDKGLIQKSKSEWKD